jgi:hypothetical protein
LRAVRNELWPVAAARAVVVKSMRSKSGLLTDSCVGEEASKRIVGFAKDDLTSHASCLLLLTIPLYFDVGANDPRLLLWRVSACLR